MLEKLVHQQMELKFLDIQVLKLLQPLKSFKVIKNFGTYYDPIYKIKLFNESIV